MCFAERGIGRSKSPTHSVRVYLVTQQWVNHRAQESWVRVNRGHGGCSYGREQAAVSNHVVIAAANRQCVPCRPQDSKRERPTPRALKAPTVQASKETVKAAERPRVTRCQLLKVSTNSDVSRIEHNSKNEDEKPTKTTQAP